MSLVDRVKGLSGPDEQVEKDILAYLGYTWRGMGYWNDLGKEWRGPTFFTHKIDDAVALVERMNPSFCYRVVKQPPSVSAAFGAPYWATCGLPGKQEQAVGPTPAIALVLALLHSPDQKGERA